MQQYSTLLIRDVVAKQKKSQNIHKPAMKSKNLSIDGCISSTSSSCVSVSLVIQERFPLIIGTLSPSMAEPGLRGHPKSSA